MDFAQLTARQQEYFLSGKTLPLSHRHAVLDALEQAVRADADRLCGALRQDLGKSPTESYMCEVGLALEEIRYLRRHVRRWMAPRRVKASAAQWPAACRVTARPKGRVLIMSPWNYPVLLTLEPLAGALAAGCCTVVKPSAYAPATSRVLAQLLGRVFPSELVQVVEGGRAENTALLDEPYDHIFFTGSAQVGKLVLEKAAPHLCPVTLELGGKSPCIVDQTADLSLAARRIAFGKYLNCGQTCVAPDYVLCHSAVKEKFLCELKAAIIAQYGNAPLENPDYGRIVNRRHFDRLAALLTNQHIVCGGGLRPDTLQIEPTVLSGVGNDDPVMGQEIFGPILPVLTYDTIEQAIASVGNRPRPLALYIFTRSRPLAQRVLQSCQFGGGCVNDTVLHLTSSRLPFGGTGASGMGCYHGRYSFDTFSHQTAVVDKAPWPDLAARYQPYTTAKQKLLHRVMR